MKELYENRLYKKQINIAVENLKRMSEQETDKLKKLDIDYVITVLTNKPHGSMPF
ncbi:hypothetical protein P4U05_17070 [Bacillus paranthracis]|uniref:hypothetical protein n=1 Tax=Bacillus phage phi4B1 TaxID=1643324 RepID=UPI000200F2A7|nr:hypothetical protein [Bacillus paranthracis]YP_009206338.1 hypothetical protein XO26_0039 [Bacillus phage phi4B1]ADY20332.1 XRE family transcriptional regulator [Bacillus thuringiensis serovar finitimus YBT-020]ALF02547.1 hypothetical protein XO26_0039 [Bacillus phage phi4B1]MCR6799389.1 hypothetical protein [Bacillus paranthracis]MEC3358451.1 hypothetical protein [Bacillus paranthracis]MED0785446.1 hypothetical protein [Bacillus paranthracis]